MATCLRATVSLLVVGLVLEVWLVRRRGFSIDADGLTLRYAFYRRTVVWEDVEGFEWRPRLYSKMMKYLWVQTPRGRLQIPSTSFAEETWMGKRAAHYLSSTNVVGPGGQQEDALTFLNASLAANRR